MKLCYYLLILHLPLAFGKKITLTEPSDINDARDIEAAIREATDDGSEPGTVIIDGANGPFIYENCGDNDSIDDRTIHVSYSDLTITGLNQATIHNCQVGIQFNDDVPIDNVVIEGITFETCAEGRHGGIESSYYSNKFLDTPRANIIIRNNKIIAPTGFGISLYNSINSIIYNNDVRTDRTSVTYYGDDSGIILHNTSGTQFTNNKVTDMIFVDEGSNGNIIQNNEMKDLSLDWSANNIIINNTIDNVRLDSCTNTLIEGNTIKTFSDAIYIGRSVETQVLNNKITSFRVGVNDRWGSTTTRIHNNEIEVCRDGESGIEFYRTTNSEISNNIINADPAISLDSGGCDSSNNDIINNIVDGEILDEYSDYCEDSIKDNKIKNNEQPDTPLPNLCGVTVLMQDRENIVDRTKHYFPDIDVYLFQQKNGRLKLIVGEPKNPLYVLWKSGYRGKRGGGYYTRLQGDGNLVTRPGKPDVVDPRAKSVWTTKSAGESDQYILALSNDKKRLSIFAGSPDYFCCEVWFAPLTPKKSRA